tara:strand:- start:5217 stop:5555 length:339 start_codon:yes stop_codon:yes gene_type:complete
VPLDASLKMLHDVIQGAMGWLEYHLWEFEAGDRRYGLPIRTGPDDELSAAKNAKFKPLIDRGVRQFLYTYDMGDNWEHTVGTPHCETSMVWSRKGYRSRIRQVDVVLAIILM